MNTLTILFLCSFLLTLAAFLGYYFSQSRYRKEVVRRADRYFSEHGGGQSYPVPAVLTGKGGTIVWFNSLFSDKFSVDPHRRDGNCIAQFLGDRTLEDLAAAPAGTDIDYNDRTFTVYASEVDEKTDSYFLFFLDNTELKKEAADYLHAKPAILYLVLDNLEEIQKTFKSSECEVINGGVETILESWASAYPCLIQKISEGRYFCVMEDRGLSELAAKKFDILKKIREYRFGETPVGVTASIGAGRGNSLMECNEFALSALEMSQSRGGDQATIDHNGSMEFFGGTISGTTNSSKVKARIVSANLADQIRQHDIIFAVGHMFSDFDSVGASIGVYEMAKALGKPCYVVVDRDKSMANQLIDRYLEKTGNRSLFVSESKALSLKRAKNALLIVVDTHRPKSLEYDDLAEHFTDIAVIDHHRRTANYLKDTVLFYNESNSSSACEMVTELLQYLPSKAKIDPMSAEALLSGIMLDTRNFVLGTGVRTFEAAAFLKAHGADTVAVKQFFTNSLDNYKVKASILSNAETYCDCILATTKETAPNMRVIASQVADDMLSVTDVKSSYVLFEENGKINISARSLGKMNVQVIMERLGGGGHFTMAATQMENTTMEEALARTKQSISEYLEME